MSLTYKATGSSISKSAEYTRAYRARNPELVRRRNRDYLRKWRAENPEKWKAIWTASYQKRKAAGPIKRKPMTVEQRERSRIYHRNYAQTHKEEFRASDRKRYWKMRAVTPKQKMGPKPMPVEMKRAKEKAARKAYYERNREQLSQKTAKWQRANRDKTRGYVRKWASKNRRKIALKKNDQERQKRLNDPLYRFICRTRISVHKRLADYGTKKKNQFCEMLGCDTATLVAYVESQFEPGMTWENKGDWHLDHVLPLKAFVLSDPEHQRAAFHFSNVRPIWKSANLQKGAAVDFDLIRAWLCRFQHPVLKQKAEEILAQC